MKSANKTASMIVTMFTQQNQELQLAQARKEFDQLTREIAERRKKLLSELNKGKAQEKEKVDANKAEKFKNMDEHRIPLEELEQRFQTSSNDGLTKDVANQRLQEVGKNELTQKEKVPWYMKLIHELTSMFSMLLWVGSILCFIAYGLAPEDPSNLYLGIVIVVVNTLTGVITFFQNAKSEAIMDSFKNFIPPETLVIRDGQQQKLPASNLVPGDVVIVENGKRIPADIRILESNEMKVDNSSLTGESLLLMRSLECTNPANPLETKNLAFFGTLCKEGNGKGLVIFTGDNTVIGQIAGLVDSSGGDDTTLRKELNNFIKNISVISTIFGVIFFVLGFAIGYPPITNLVFGIGIIVANVPEGLLATVTVALTLTAKKLAYKKVLVKNLEGVETLGSTSCVCSDKTGTLTQNKMTVENLWYNNKKHKGANLEKMGQKHQYEYDVNELGFKILQETAVLCSEAVFDNSLPQDQKIRIQNAIGLNQQQKDQKLKEANEKWELNFNKMLCQEKPTIGDASETALIKFFQPINDIQKMRQSRTPAKDSENKLAKMPFNSNNKYAFIIVEYETEDSHYCLLSKGAPERIWKLCNQVYKDGQIESKDEEWEKSFEQINEQFGRQGERVLGFAKLHLPKEQFPFGYQFNMDKMNFPFNNQVFVGLISLIDPPKDNVPYAVIKCKTAGIQVIMVTGDQPVTATAIARQCNIITEKTVDEIMIEKGISFEEAFHQSNALVIHGDKLTKMAIDDEGLPEDEKGRQLQEWLSKPQLVFARTSPAQKLIIVDGCQKRGHIVAVTGDGVNDSPAIKKADIGIAMGITGSDVAKDAADMILLNDDFSNIVIGIEEGRKIFDNLKKSMAYCLTSNISELVPFIGFVIFRLPLPLTTVLILCIDLGTDVFPCTTFVFEDAEIDIMTRKPRSKSDHLVGGKMFIYAYLQNGFLSTYCGFFQWFASFYDFGFYPSNLLFIGIRKTILPKINDVYDPQDPWFGNTNLKEIFQDGTCTEFPESEVKEVDWIFANHSKLDLRMAYLECKDGKIQQLFEWAQCTVNLVSPYTNRPYCYTTEASNYAQTTFLYGIVVGQIANYQGLRSLINAGSFQGFSNYYMFFAFWVEFMLTVCLSYVQVFNAVFGTRDVLFIHYGTGALPFALVMLIWAEGRKYLIRRFKSKTSFPSWWERCVQF
ncbi:unnamed protein product (macronuclear) [Paramecium tetraurelia]|uniref:Cation-transporting P-type ATPase N-terminal domain-containing protein n=1 Tax=Paramecium tetraurelia TaxID=5888 RepID=A0BML3_PARTE|nr:uncharacterized protein GSPATT00030416001 [Paramecium tetraurelia]CAK59780.1 unnamed protein product [Paramecium tetraurelia]|eukprot:XP_001427178.1 hypothetical protein (macronuclear) [Paramecium tetraurelia strain d4-2]